jgi:glyoxylase-like metal-dependent hydrolase (beta-lactamase superfamily II)
MTEPQLLVPGVYFLAFEIGQVYLWARPDGVTVVDTGISGSATAIVEAIQAIGRRPEDVTEIVLTHCHDDHIGGAAELVQLTGATLLAHPSDAAAIRGHEPAPPPDLTEREREMLATILPRVPRAERVDVGHEVRDGDAIAGGAGRIVGAPGHTPGSIALFLPAPGVLFTGDTIAFSSGHGQPILGPFNVDRTAAIQSVRKLAKLEFEVACFGHGPPIVGGASGSINALAGTR